MEDVAICLSTLLYRSDRPHSPVGLQHADNDAAVAILLPSQGADTLVDLIRHSV